MTVTTRSPGDRPAGGRPARMLAVAGFALVTVLVAAACASTVPTKRPTDGGGSVADGAPTTSSASGVSPSSGSPDGSGKGSDTVLDTLVGRTFVSTEVQGHDLVAGSAITLAVPSADVVSLNAGCNTMSGQPAVDGGVLRVPQLAMTAMGCAPDLMAQDTWLSGLLTKGMDLDVNGDTVVLAADGITITLIDRKVAQPDLPFVGTEWTLDGIVRGDAVTNYADLTATLTTDGTRLSYRACNSHSGPIAITGDSATAGPMISTKMACTGPAAEVDKAMESVLDGTFTFAVDGTHLTVTGAGGAGLTFTGVAAPGGAPSSAPSTVEPASPASQVAPGTAGPTVSETTASRSVAGQHDSIPPQPTPNGQTSGN